MTFHHEDTGTLRKIYSCFSCVIPRLRGEC